MNNINKILSRTDLLPTHFLILRGDTAGSPGAIADIAVISSKVTHRVRPYFLLLAED